MRLSEKITRLSENYLVTSNKVKESKLKISYMTKYSFRGLLNKQDRIFSLLNGSSVAATMLILISLTGLLYSFKNYTKSTLQKLPLRIEICNSEDALRKDLSSVEPQLKALPGTRSIYERVPTSVFFLSSQGHIISPKNGVRGCTIRPEEPLLLKDIYGKKIRFLSKKQLKQNMDEVGIIISFSFLKKMGFLNQEAIFEKPKTWKDKSLPSEIQITDEKKGYIFPVPVIGIIPHLNRGDYLITEDFYSIIVNWHKDFLHMLKNRRNQTIVPVASEIMEAYYVLNEDQLMLLEDKYEILEYYQKQLHMSIYTDSWQDKDSFQERLTIRPLMEGQSISYSNLMKLDTLLRKFRLLKSLGEFKLDRKKPIIRKWTDFPKFYHHQGYVDAALYVKSRRWIRPMLEKLRTMGLVAISPLERYLKSFEQQDHFFTTLTIGIFILVLFLAGVVLFSTFYSSILRKKKEIGIFKAYGASRALVLALYYIQSTIVILSGCTVGAVGGFVLGSKLSQKVSQFAKLGDQGLAFSLPLSYFAILTTLVLLTCWLAIFIPAHIATGIDPADAVRH